MNGLIDLILGIFSDAVESITAKKFVNKFIEKSFGKYKKIINIVYDLTQIKKYPTREEVINAVNAAGDKLSRKQKENIIKNAQTREQMKSRVYETIKKHLKDEAFGPIKNSWKVIKEINKKYRMLKNGSLFDREFVDDVVNKVKKRYEEAKNQDTSRIKDKVKRRANRFKFNFWQRNKAKHKPNAFKDAMDRQMGIYARRKEHLRKHNVIRKNKATLRKAYKQKIKEHKNQIKKQKRNEKNAIMKVYNEEKRRIKKDLRFRDVQRRAKWTIDDARELLDLQKDQEHWKKEKLVSEFDQTIALVEHFNHISLRWNLNQYSVEDDSGGIIPIPDEVKKDLSLDRIDAYKQSPHELRRKIMAMNKLLDDYGYDPSKSLLTNEKNIAHKAFMETWRMRFIDSDVQTEYSDMGLSAEEVFDEYIAPTMSTSKYYDKIKEHTK